MKGNPMKKFNALPALRALSAAAEHAAQHLSCESIQQSHVVLLGGFQLG